MHKILIPAFTAALLVAASPAAAGQVTIRVSGDGLDFTHAADIATMTDRIAVAVRKACSGPSAAWHSVDETVEECIADGTAKALAQLDLWIAEPAS